MDDYFTVKAISDFEASVEGELSFDKDEIFKVHSNYLGKTMYETENSLGNKGMIPSDRVRQITNEAGSEDSLYHNDISENSSFEEKRKLTERQLSRNSLMSASSFSMNALGSGPTKIKMPKIDDNMAIEDWLTLYEARTEYLEDSERIKALSDHFDFKKNSLKWFIGAILNKRHSLSWVVCKRLILTQFGHNEVRPIISAIDRRYKVNEKLKKYFKEKMEFLNQTTLDEIDKIALLNHGLNEELQLKIKSKLVMNTNEWLAKMKEIDPSNFVE